jgi:hypothetical protein
VTGDAAQPHLWQLTFANGCPGRKKVVHHRPDRASSGTWNPGRNFNIPVRRSGHAIWVKLSSTYAWAMEEIRVRIASQGGAGRDSSSPRAWTKPSRNWTFTNIVPGRSGLDERNSCADTRAIPPVRSWRIALANPAVGTGGSGRNVQTSTGRFPCACGGLVNWSIGRIWLKSGALSAELRLLPKHGGW